MPELLAQQEVEMSSVTDGARGFRWFPPSARRSLFSHHSITVRSIYRREEAPKVI